MACGLPGRRSEVRKIANIDALTGRVTLIDSSDPFRFNCLRCGSLCCRLGGPVLSAEDLTRLQTTFSNVSSLVAMTDSKYGTKTALRSKANGECVFLCQREGLHECSIYPYRPAVCRSFPFILRETRGQIELFALPCRGLNKNNGDSIDGKFVSSLLAHHCSMVKSLSGTLNAAIFTPR